MKKILLSYLLMAVASPVLASGGAHWGYTGHESPEHWGELSPKFQLCATGKNQAPIDLHAMIEAELMPLGIAYKAGGEEVVNNGHSIQVNYTPGSTLDVDGHIFELKQFHFHTPSENTIEGESFPMEMHLVHLDESGNIAVIGVMFKEGEENAELAKAWSVMPKQADQKAAPAAVLDAAVLLPENRDYYRFNGSLTTPPCTEGVTWIVMKEPVTVSAEQVEAFAHVMHHPNNRPVQPVNARPVLK
jgi:carbonic anhydrase